MDSFLDCTWKNISFIAAFLSCKLYDSMMEIQNSFVTKMYHLILMILYVFFGFLAFTEGKEIIKYIPILNSLCPEDTCDVILVYRLSLAYFIFHIVLAILLYGVKSPDTDRANIQNASWQLKLPFLVFLLLICGLIPEYIFLFYGWFVLFVSVIFMIAEMCIIINFAFNAIEMANNLFQMDSINIHSKTGPGNACAPCVGMILIVSVLSILSSLIIIVYGITLIETLENCTINLVIVSLYIVAAISTLIFSLHPKIQSKFNTMGLFQASIIIFYLTYLLWNALIADDPGQCTAEYMIGGLTYWITVIIGSFFSIMSVQYMSIPHVDQLCSVYNYSKVNLLYACCSMYICMILTNWSVIRRYEDGEVEMSLDWIPLMISIFSIIFITFTFIFSLLVPSKLVQSNNIGENNCNNITSINDISNDLI